ncbi:methyltransferase domain-containing protein [Sutcliffiella horikoshii]|uniref:methyltransferase domain-containing protein n=1 Tax=Sutcliffiella horikoshii TaxID=79883 RepID=UPI001F247836|nr:methyltransferase domain-containing protein [Sutcliffiella horikoshii]
MAIILEVKNRTKMYKGSKSRVIRTSVFLLEKLWNTSVFIKKFALDPEYRSIHHLQLFNSRAVHQTTPFTYMDRYPEIFSACHTFLKDKENVKILSYGCSTGEEVLTLRKYFPNAEIIGADINKHSLLKCNNLKTDNKIKFIYSSTKNIQSHGPFDAIFCMAVFQRKPHFIAAKGIKSLKKIYPFEKFENEVSKLDKHVKPSGLLVIHFSQYSLEDTKVSQNYKALGDYNQDSYQNPVFDKISNIRSGQHSQKSIFIKNE